VAVLCVCSVWGLIFWFWDAAGVFFFLWGGGGGGGVQ